MRQGLRWLLPGLGIIALAWLAGAAWPGLPAGAASQAGPGPERIGGSAFLVAPGMLVTNAHVALRCRAEGRPILVAGTPGPWRIAAEDTGTDLALLAGPASADAPLSLSAAQRLPPGTPLMLLGYPTQGPSAGRLQGSAGPLRRAALTVHEPAAGRAVSFVMTDRSGQEVAARWEDGLRYFGPGQAGNLRWRLEIGAPTGGGSSGGPVLDAAGNVVGVIYAGGRDSTSAVPLSDLREFLARANVAPAFHTPAGNRTPDWPAILARASRATRRLAC